MEEKSNKKYTPKNDYVFKRIFGKVGNEEITKDFIKSVTGVEYKHINLKNTPILEADIIGNKMGVLDVKVEGDEKTNIDIEMQVTSNEYIADRILWYWSKMYSDVLKEGNEYDNTKRVICILFADFKIKKLKEVAEYITVWNIREKRHKDIILTDKLEIIIIELGKLKKDKNQEDKNLVSWCEFIKAPENLEDSIMEENKNIKKAKEELDKINSDEHERMLAELREKAIMDEHAIRRTGYNEGKEARNIEIAKNMIRKNIDKNTISEITGLSLEEIEKLKI